MTQHFSCLEENPTARALNKSVGDVTCVVLDRPRHEGIIAELREAGRTVAPISLVHSLDLKARMWRIHVAFARFTYKWHVHVSRVGCERWKTEELRPNNSGVSDAGGPSKLERALSSSRTGTWQGRPPFCSFESSCQNPSI